jgi:hypothetical protein
MMEVRRREAIAMLLLSLTPEQALAAAAALAEKKGSSERTPRERPTREFRDRPERADRPSNRREAPAGARERPETRLRDREKRATGESLKESTGTNAGKKRERENTSRSAGPHDRSPNDGKSKMADHAKAKIAEQKAVANNAAAARAEKARSVTKAAKTSIRVAQVGRWAAATGAASSAAGKWAAKHAGTAKVLGRAGPALTVAVHAFGVYEIYQKNKQAGTPVSGLEATQRELHRSYVEPVQRAGQFVDRQIDRAGQYVGPPLERGITDWMNQGYGNFPQR